MTKSEQLLADQKEFFAAGSSAMPDARLAALYCLNDTIENSRPMLEMLLRAEMDGDAVAGALNAVCESGSCWQKDLRRLLRTGWKKEQSGAPAPCGVVLLFGAPGASFVQTMTALMTAVAAGNTVVLSLEKTASATADSIRALLTETFEPEYIAVSGEASAELSTLPFDKVFDAGAAAVEALSGRDGLRLFSRFEA